VQSCRAQGLERLTSFSSSLLSITATVCTTIVIAIKIMSDSQNFSCVAVFTCKKGLAKEVGNMLNLLVEQTRKESGCISYEVFISTEDENKLLVNELYKDELAFEAHSKSSYLSDFKKKIGDLVESISVRTS